VTEDGLWTLAQLCDHVAAALAEDYPGQRSGRVAELPNSRTIRWYTTIGLVDRPAGTRGRTALYNRRHLWQLVAVKRLQAQGRALADIQRELVGATDATLARLAGQEPADLDGRRVAPRDGAFWTARPTAAAPARVDSDSVAVPGVRVADTVTVLLEPGARQPDPAEIAAIEAAAAPLVDLINRLGLRPATGKDTP
jgi:DNA-binding transcriptional MerR regulator